MTTKNTTRANVKFKYPLHKTALHIDYLRLRCGREAQFSERIDKESHVGAYIAFSEWDVVLFIPTEELYPENLIGIYSNPTLTSAIAGSAGYFSYVWDHPVNHGWEATLLAPAGPSSRAHMAMLMSLRFTDRFRLNFGLGTELLFCDFLQRTLEEFSGVTAVVAHSLGWNDTTIMLKADEGREDELLQVLTRIRYCRESQCLRQPAPAEDLCVIAATYSHLLGDLHLYVRENLSFGALATPKFVTRARMLVRVSPTVEKDLRETLRKTFKKVKLVPATGTEFGHYNFSADLTDAFHKGGPNAVKIIQGFRRKIERFMRRHKIDSTSFSETTTEITLNEDITGAPSAPRLAEQSPLRKRYLKRIQKLSKNTPTELEHHASKMTRHRLAILLGTIATYLEDPVRCSVVGHICRFLDVEFEDVLQKADRAGQEDLCHILEYALHQATDGLSQFQHDANSLGLSGRGGYSRLIQAVEHYLLQLLSSLDLPLIPLLTFGLRPSHEGATQDYWIDIPFSTAFRPSRWYIVFHEVAHMCWSHIFEWRLDSFQSWNEITSGDEEITKSLDKPKLQRKEFMQAREILDELFPNYLMLHVVTTGDLDRLAELMIARELLTRLRPVLIRSLLQRMIFHVLLELHDEERQKLSVAERRRFRSAVELKGHEKESIKVSYRWWKAWSDLDRKVNGDALQRKRIEHRVASSLESAATNLRRLVHKLVRDERFAHRDSLYGADNIAALISDVTFKEDAQRIVRTTLRILALRHEDYAERQRKSFDKHDPSAAEFGYVLAKIDTMRATASDRVRQWTSYGTMIEDGWVLANGSGETSLSRLLSDDKIASTRSNLKGAVLMSSLSATLSLWHNAVTQLAQASNDGIDSDALVKTLKRLKVAESFNF